MGVYIKGMDMPKSCGKCKMHFLSSNDYVCCSITDRIPKSVAKFKNSKTDLDFRKASIEDVSRPDWCPHVEVKAPHGRLIDADALYDAVERRYRVSTGAEHRAERDFLDLISDAPTVLEAEE